MSFLCDKERNKFMVQLTCYVFQDFVFSPLYMLPMSSSSMVKSQNQVITSSLITQKFYESPQWTSLLNEVTQTWHILSASTLSSSLKYHWLFLTSHQKTLRGKELCNKCNYFSYSVHYLLRLKSAFEVLEISHKNINAYFMFSIILLLLKFLHSL